MSKFTTFRALVLLLVTLLLPAGVAGQGVEVRRPYRGLFGGDPNDRTASSFNVQLTGAYDENIFAGNGEDRPVVGAQKSGFITGVSATLTLQRAGEKLSAGVSGTSDVRHYDSGAFTAVAHHVAAFGRFRVARRTNLRFSGGVGYSPLYTPLLMMVPSGESVTSDGVIDSGATTVGDRWNGDYSIAERASLNWQGTAEVSQALTSRTSISARYSGYYLDFTDEEETQRFETLAVSSGYRISRYSTFRAGYGLNSYRLENDGQTRRYHDFDFGLDYSRPLALSGRRTRFTITPGFALVDNGGVLQLHAAGSAALDHEIGRTWTARALYSRGVRFVEGVDTEVLAHTGQAGVQGLIGRRLQLLVETQLVMSNQEQDERDYRAAASSARFNYALTRRLSAYVQYVYYNYRFGEAVLLPGTESRQTSRQGIRVGITLWTPVLQ